MYFSIALSRRQLGLLRPQNHAYTAVRETSKSAATCATETPALMQALPSFTPSMWLGAALLTRTRETVYPCIIFKGWRPPQPFLIYPSRRE